MAMERSIIQHGIPACKDLSFPHNMNIPTLAVILASGFLCNNGIVPCHLVENPTDYPFVIARPVKQRTIALDIAASAKGITYVGAAKPFQGDH